HRSGESYRIRSNPDKGWSGTERAVVGNVSQEHILGKGVEEDAVSAANYRHTLAEQVVREAEAWSEVFVVGVIETGGTTSRSHLHQGAAVRGKKPVELVILLSRHAKVVPAHTKVQRQSRRPAEAVLQVQSMTIFVLVPIGIAGRLAPTRW